MRNVLVTCHTVNDRIIHTIFCLVVINKPTNRVDRGVDLQGSGLPEVVRTPAEIRLWGPQCIGSYQNFSLRCLIIMFIFKVLSTLQPIKTSNKTTTSKLMGGGTAPLWTPLSRPPSTMLKMDLWHSVPSWSSIGYLWSVQREPSCRVLSRLSARTPLAVCRPNTQWTWVQPCREVVERYLGPTQRNTQHFASDKLPCTLSTSCSGAPNTTRRFDGQLSQCRRMNQIVSNLR